MFQEPGVRSTSTAVLLVDDEPQLRRLLAYLLVRDGNYHVMTACSGEEALALSRDRTERIDILITDLDMGRMTGIELYKHIREERPEIGVLFISAMAYRIGETLPDCPVLEKPFMPRQFVAKVAEVSQRPKSDRSRLLV